MIYRLLPRGVLRLADHIEVTRDMVEWDDYRAWLKSGGVPEPMAPPPPVPNPTPAEIIARLTVAVQAHLDAVARTRNYDGILSCASYATSTNPQFAAEGQACVQWRDAVWEACYAIMAEVLAGTRQPPSEVELIDELPGMGWV